MCTKQYHTRYRPKNSILPNSKIQLLFFKKRIDKIEIQTVDVFTLMFLPWRFEKESHMIQLVLQEIK